MCSIEEEKEKKLKGVKDGFRLIYFSIKNGGIIEVFEKTVDGKSFEFTGTTGTGKTTAIDLIFDIVSKGGKTKDIKKGEPESVVECVFSDASGNYTINCKKTRKKNKNGNIKTDLLFVLTNKVTGQEVKLSKNDLYNTVFSTFMLDPESVLDGSDTTTTRRMIEIADFGEYERPEEIDEKIEKCNVDIENAKRAVVIRKKDLSKLGDCPDLKEGEKIDVGVKAIELQEVEEKIKADNKALNDIKDVAACVKENEDKAKKESDEIDDIEGGIKALNENIEAIQATIKEEQDKVLEKKNNITDLETKIGDHSIDRRKKVEAYNKRPEKIADLLSRKEAITGEIKSHTENVEALEKYKEWKKAESSLEQSKADRESHLGKLEGLKEDLAESFSHATFPLDGLTIKDREPYWNGIKLADEAGGIIIMVALLVAAEKIKKQEGANHRLRMLRMDGIGACSRNIREMIYTLCDKLKIQVAAARTVDDGPLEINIIEGGNE